MQTIVTIATLVLLLASLLVVNRARKEANEERLSARAEAGLVRDEAKALFSEAQQREERVALRERQFAEDQRNAQTYSRGLEDRVAVVARDEKRLASQRDEMKNAQEGALAAVAGLSVAEAKAELTSRLRRTLPVMPIVTPRRPRRNPTRARDRSLSKRCNARPLRRAHKPP